MVVVVVELVDDELLLDEELELEEDDELDDEELLVLVLEPPGRTA